MTTAKNDQATLTAILDAMVLTPHTGLRTAARKCGVSESSIFGYQQASASHEREGRSESPYNFEWLGHRTWYHRHIRAARLLSIQALDMRLRELAITGTTEPMFNNQTGMPIWEVDAQIASDAMSMNDDDWAINYGERKRSDVFVRVDGKLVQATKQIPPNPQLLIKACSALIPEYSERIQHDVNVGGVLRVNASTPPLKQIEQPIIDADFTLAIEDKVQQEATNVLAVADRAKSARDFEERFGGKRLVECVYFYDADNKLQPPIDGVTIVEGSSAHKLYNEAGIEVTTVAASELIGQGFVNDFLLNLAAPEQAERVKSLRAGLRAGVVIPKPSPVEPVSSSAAAAQPAPQRRTSPNDAREAKIDAGGIGYGRPIAGGVKVV